MNKVPTKFFSFVYGVPHFERKCEKRLVAQLFSFSESESDFDDGGYYNIHRDHLEPSPWSPSSVPEVLLPNSVFWSHLARTGKPKPSQRSKRRVNEDKPNPDFVRIVQS